MNRFRLLAGILLAGTLLAGFAGNALAALTPACTDIVNRATLNYAVNNVPQEVIESSEGGNTTPGVDGGGDTTFAVAAKVDLLVTNIHVDKKKTATGTGNVMTFRIDNEGNDTQRYMLQLYNSATLSTFLAATDAFDMENVKVYTDTDSTFGSGGTQKVIDDTDAAVDGTDLGLTDPVNAGASIYVHVVADVPAGRATGDDAIYTLKARTYQTSAAGHKGTDGNDGSEAGNTGSGAPADPSSTVCGTPVVLADGDADLQDFGGPNGTDPDPAPNVSDVTRDGDYYATGYFEVSTAALSVKKTQTPLWDPVNLNSSPKYIPGAYVTYTLVIENTGNASATLTDIVDDLADDYIALDPDLFVGGNDADPSDGGYGSGSSGKSVMVLSSGTGNTRATATTASYHTGDIGDIDDDGVAYSGGVGGTLTVYFTAPSGGGTVLPAEGSYAAGELKPGEKVTITFNVIIQ